MIAVELTVGRHAAGDGADVDPIVAAALSRRPAVAAPGAPRHGQPTGGEGEGGLGWPGEPADGAGLGWPADDGTAAGAGSGVSLARRMVTPDARARHRGAWRRLFGGRDSAAA